MSRRELDAWFAKADDVLADWQGSDDAMSVRGEPDDADPELPLLGDNGADQTWPLPRRRHDPGREQPRSPVVRLALGGARGGLRVVRTVIVRVARSA